MDRKVYPSDVSDEEWAFVAPYLTLMTEEAPQRDYPLRAVFSSPSNWWWRTNWRSTAVISPQGFCAVVG